MLRGSGFVLAVVPLSVCLVANVAAEPTIAWQPVSATGCFYIDGNEIIIWTLPEYITLEIQVSGWGSAPGTPELGAYQAVVRFGEISGPPPDALQVKGWPDSPGEGVYYDVTRPDRVCPVCDPGGCTGWDPGGIEFWWGCTIAGGSVVDDGGVYYGGTLVLWVSEDAAGTYTIGFNPSSTKTFLRDQNEILIPGLTLHPALITSPIGMCCWDIHPDGTNCTDGVTYSWCMSKLGGCDNAWYRDDTCPEECPCMGCATDMDCNDNNECTTDTCVTVEPICGCVLEPNYNVATECCDPIFGETVLIDDESPCTEDYCDPATGTPIHFPLPAGTPCENPDPCVIDESCAVNGECAGDRPEDLNVPCAGDNDCPAEWFCNPETEFCDCLTSPHDARKNRYISFYSDHGGMSVAFEVSMTSSAYFPDSTGTLGWVAEPGENDAAGITAGPYFTDAWPEVVHVGDCRIVPVATYGVRSTPDGVTFGDPLEVSTIREPAPKKWGDVVGSFTGTRWNPPNRVVNMDDVMAAVQTFKQLSESPHWTWIDVDDQGPNRAVNFTDIFQIVQGFKGEPYPFSDPAACP